MGGVGASTGKSAMRMDFAQGRSGDGMEEVTQLPGQSWLHVLKRSRADYNSLPGMV